MKNFLLLLLSFSFVLSAISQNNKKPEAFYMLDKDYKGTTQDKAAYFVHSLQINDTCWQFDTYNIAGPMVSSEKYKDDKAAVLHGESVYFNSKGTRDSIANYKNGLPEGSFYYLNDTGRTYIQKEFSKGILIETIDRIKKDSVDEAEWEKKNNAKDSDEKESEFPGGKGSWSKYLSKNLVYPERAQNLQKQGMVVLQFIVDTEGHIFGQEIVQSVEYSLDQEALRMINESPAWIPAFQYGKKVKSYKKQPLIFKLE